MRCFGRNDKGQLGRSGPNLFEPSSDVLTNVQAIAASATHTCAVLKTGGLRCWGDNTLGQLGDGTTTSSATPVAAAALEDARAVVVGEAHTCVLRSTGTVRCFGDDGYGQLGTYERSTPSPALEICE